MEKSKSTQTENTPQDSKLSPAPGPQKEMGQ